MKSTKLCIKSTIYIALSKKLALSKAFITWRPVSTIDNVTPITLLLHRLIKQTGLTLKQNKKKSV